jgi:hypothetical protein
MRLWCLFLIIIFSSIKILAQNVSVPILEREITVSISNEPLEVALSNISREGNFIFSYNPDAINANRRVSISVNQKSVRHTLNVLFNGSVTYKVKGKYIILRRHESGKVQMIEGYVYDSKSGHKLTETTVYDKDLLISAITDKYGYFKLELPVGQPRTALYISKEGYSDTLLTPLPGKANYVNVELSLKTLDVGRLKNSKVADTEVRPAWLPQWLVPSKIKINTRNLTDTVFRNIQISVLPFISTNKLLTGSVINNASINLTAGYVQGVRVFELGGFFNIVGNNAGVCQLAGAGNMVGGSFHGVQAAGFINIAKTMKGVQASGALNIVRKDAGVCQLAGFGNITRGSFHGIQASGAFNITKDIKGCQISGFLNHSQKVNGVQLAGAVNNAEEVLGLQISGFINRAKVVKGLQLSVINIADSCDGLPIGVFSYVKKGYHKLEFSADEVFYTNLAFRTGVKRFHSILMAGIRPDNFGSPLWTYGYGFGTTFGNPDKILFDIDLTNQQVIKGGDYVGNSLYKFYVGLDKKLTPKTFLAFGITYNFFVSDTKSKNFNSHYSGIIPYSLSDQTFSNGQNLKTWPGAKLSLRFL